MKLLIFGNSHLIGFWDHWHTEFEKIENLEATLVVSNFLESPVSQCLNSGRFVHRTDIAPGHLKRLHGNLRDFYFPDERARQEQPTVVLLFGTGICGEATHGSMCGGMKTAKFSYHANHQKYLDGQTNVVGPVSDYCLDTMYAHHYAQSAKLLERWMKVPGLEVVGWVASPNMTESSARMTFGDHIVDSGILRWHYDKSWVQCVTQFTAQGLQDYLVNPNEGKVGPNGGLEDKYQFMLGNNHANGEFYASHIPEVISRILSSNAVLADLPAGANS
ncbi:MAG: hypothetical protein KDK02_14610 [Rhodobacteraceae bacterium]|nr:hypothetical protein [Paracoccaceae bacterium]